MPLTTLPVRAVLGLTAQQARFDDVVRNLRNPDPKARMEVAAAARASRSTSRRSLPIAPLVNDPLDGIQLEAIGTELSFCTRRGMSWTPRRAALIIEIAAARAAPRTSSSRSARRVAAAGAAGAGERAAQGGRRRESRRCASRRSTRSVSIAQPPLAADAARQLIKALDHYDPAIRAAAARVDRPVEGEGRRRPT